MTNSKLDYDALLFLFNTQGQWVQAPDHVMIGKGVFETVLQDNGFSKSELKKLVSSSILKRFTTKVNGGWRNTYVLPMAYNE